MRKRRELRAGAKTGKWRHVPQVCHSFSFCSLRSLSLPHSVYSRSLFPCARVANGNSTCRERGAPGLEMGTERKESRLRGGEKRKSDTDEEGQADERISNRFPSSVQICAATNGRLVRFPAGQTCRFGPRRRALLLSRSLAPLLPLPLLSYFALLYRAHSSAFWLFMLAFPL